MIDKTFWILTVLFFFSALGLLLITQLHLHKASKESVLEQKEKFKPSTALAVKYMDKLLEQQTTTSEWLTSLSLVLITIAVPILLTKVQGLSKTEKPVYLFLVLNGGLVYSLGSVVCGLLYKRYLLQSLRQNPHLHFVDEEEEVEHRVYRPVEKRYQRTRAKLEILLFVQPQFFVEGVLLLVAASFLYASNIPK